MQNYLPAFLTTSRVAALLVLLLIGVSGTYGLGQHWEKKMQQHQMEEIEKLAQNSVFQKAVALSGEPIDSKRNEYVEMRAELTKQQLLNGFRFIYVLSKRDEKVIFLVDSEPEESVDYSAPGDEYFEASEALQKIFVSKESFIEGPVTDRWGTWYSSFAPIEKDGKVFVLGADTDASKWEIKKMQAQAIGVLLTALAWVIMMVFWWSSEKKVV